MSSSTSHAPARPRPIRPSRARALSAVVVGCLAVATPEARGTGEPLKLSNATLPPVTTPAGDGYLDRVLAELSRRTGVEFCLRSVPPARGLAQANAGTLDGDVARSDVPGELFPNLRRVPEPVIEVVFAGLHTRDDIVVDTPEDFERYSVGYVRGWKIAEALFADVATAFPVRNAAQLLDMLAAGRLDVAFLTVAPARRLARSRGIETLDVTGYTIERDLFLYLHESRAEEIPALSEALESMKRDGTYRAITAGYELENR